MFKRFGRLVPILERYECRDFTKIVNSSIFYNVFKNNTHNIKVNKINNIKIPFNEQYESKDFILKKNLIKPQFNYNSKYGEDTRSR